MGKFLAEVIIRNDLLGGVYYELYSGGAGAALYLLLNNVVKRIVINDADIRIYSFWHSVLNETDRFIECIDNCTLNMEEWYKYKRIYESADNDNTFEIGFATFYLNRTNRSGILHKSGPIGGYSQTGNYLIDARFNKGNLKKRVRDIANRSSDIEIHNKDAESFIENLDHIIRNEDQIFIYLDPPYYNKGKTLYLNNYCHEQHEHLALLLKNRGDINWIVSYDNVPEIKDMYAQFRQATFSLKYSLQHKRQGSELMIFSDSIEVPQYIRIGKKRYDLPLIANPAIYE